MQQQILKIMAAAEFGEIKGKKEMKTIKYGNVENLMLIIYVHCKESQNKNIKPRE